MNRRLIPQLLAALAAAPNSSTVSNPYTSPDCVRNLRAYLRALCDLPYSGHLLVGEAPGYRGCAVTGIPFTSQKVLGSNRHPFLVDLRSSIAIGGGLTEATASIVWSHLEYCAAIPALWNVFPFHPHEHNTIQSNRKPDRAEVADGEPYLRLILDMLRPSTVIAVGGTAAKALSRQVSSSKVVCVRHPSHGGKAEFLAGVQAAGVA